MESNISYRFISDRILRKLKDTLQVQSSLVQNDLSIQLSCMQASASTLLEVKNILDGLDKMSLKNVADNLASSDGHFVLQRYLMSSYYFLQTGGMTAISAEAEVNRPSSVLIFCPLYVAVTEVLTHLLESQTFASNLASTRILQLLLQDLNVLVLPSPNPDQFKMLLANIHFLWGMSKIPATSVQFRNFSDTVLILINVFVSYQGPFEQLTTLVKSLAMFIAAEVADDETSVYLLAEESCLHFVVDILTKSVSTGEQYLNYQGVYAADIAKCIENLSRFEGLQEALLGKGVVELLVSMIQIGDPFDDSAAASALNTLIQTYGTVDVPVLFQGLASYCDYNSLDSMRHQEVVANQNILSTDKQEIPLQNNDQFKEEEILDKNSTTPAATSAGRKEELEVSLKVLPQSAEIERNTVDKNDQRKLDVEEKESLVEGLDRRKPSLDKDKNTADNMEKIGLEVPQHYKDDIKENTVVKTDVSGTETVVDMEIVTAEVNPVTDKTTSREAKSTASAQQDIKENIVDRTDVSGSDMETVVDTEIVTAEINPVTDTDETVSRKGEPSTSSQDDKKKEMGTGELNLVGDVQENVVENTSDTPWHDYVNGKQICEQDKEVLCDEAMPQPTTTISTKDVKETEEKSKLQVPLEATNQTLNADQTLYQPEDISSYLREQLENMGGEGIKYITIPTQFQPDLIEQPEPKRKQPCPQRPFQYQQSGTDPASGQDLHDIHLSLIDLGVHNMYDEKLVGLLSQILEETKLREDGIFDILNNVPGVYSYKMLRTGSMQRQLRVVPAHNQEGVNAPVTHVQPEIDYHLVLKKFVFQMLPDHGSKMDFPGFTLIGPWFEKIPDVLEEWSFCFVPRKSTEGKLHYYLSADKLKTNFLYPILVSFAGMNMLCQFLMAKGESLGENNLKRHGITVRKIEENGPAVTVYYFYKYLTVDYVLSLRHIRWPSCAAEWPNRQRHWPDSHTIKDVVNYGCHLVPKQPASVCEENPLYGLFFQYSFARAENILLNKLNDDNPVLTDCLRMLKFLCEMHFDRPQLLKSYHMQTIVLLAAERLPPSHWKADNFVKHLLDLIDDLLHCLVAQNLPNYFIPQQNLFQQFSPDFILDVAERVSKVRRNPIKYLTPSEDPARHVGILEIKENKIFRISKVRLKTVRPFYMEDVVLSNTAIDPTREEMVMAYLVNKVEQLIEKAVSEHTGSTRQPDKPLIRIRVDYSDGFTSFNIRRFGQQFVDRVANPKDILLFFRRKPQPAKAGKKGQEDTKFPHFRPEAIDNIRMEDLIKEYLTSKENALELRILTEGRMAQALREFVEKDDKDAISALVKWQLEQAQEHLKKRQNVCEENIEGEVAKHTEQIRHKEEEGDDDEEVENIRKVLAESRASQPSNENDNGVDMSGSSDDDRPPIPSTKGTKDHGGGANTSTRGTGEGRGRGRGRGRGGGRGRGRGASRAGANTSKTIMDSFASASKKRRQPTHDVVDIISDDDDDEFNIPLSSSVKTKTSQPTPTQRSTRGRSKKAVTSVVDNGDESEDSDDPFSMQPSSKRSRR